MFRREVEYKTPSGNIKATITRAIFFDIDNTLFLSQLSSQVKYTGFSWKRWDAFFHVLALHGCLIGSITNKARCPNAFKASPQDLSDNIYNGLPDILSHRINQWYDSIGLMLFGYDGQGKDLRCFLRSELVYYLGHEPTRTKSRAIQHAKDNHLGTDFPDKDIWLIDDNPENDVTAAGFNFILVPPEVYDCNRVVNNQTRRRELVNSSGLEDQCINFMFNILKNLGIKCSSIPTDLLQAITKRHYSSEPRYVTSSLVVCNFWHRSEKSVPMGDLGLKNPSGPPRFSHP